MPYIVTSDELISDLRPPVPDADGARIRWLISAAAGGAQHGIVAELRLEAGAEQPLHRHANAEEVAIVLEGTATLVTAGGEQPAPAGTPILADREVWHGIRAGDSPVRLLAIYGGESDVDRLAVELADGVVSGEPPRTLDATSLPRNMVHNPEMGFFNMGARWLVAEDGLPSAGLVIGRSAYGEPDLDGGHVLHRHLAGEEFLYLLDGEAAHLTEDGEIAMGAGDIAFIPSPEWHGIWNTGTSAVNSIFGYLGADSLASVGYELHPAAEPR